jgi:hypothetical protein
MILDPLDIPDELLEAQEQGRLVVFAGSGVSRGPPSDLPDFRGLAAEVAKDTRFENDLTKYEQRLDGYFGELARSDVKIQELVRQRIGVSTSLPTDVHRSILDLFQDPKDIRIVTTNFDPHFTSVVAERKLKCDQYFAPALPLGHRFRGIVYLHGSLQREDDPLVLSDEDFGRAYMTEGWARDFLRGMFDTYATLFVGYSHTDPPAVYLARGMSALHLAPRYALVGQGDEGFWKSLGVKPITFEQPDGKTDFSELGRGLYAWAAFSKDQPTDIAQKVRDILRSPEKMKPAKSQSSLLVRCLGRSDEYHFFTSEAVGWRWVEWANEQGLLKPLFGLNSTELTEPQQQLAWWLAKMLLAETSDRGLLLIAQHDSRIGRALWLSLCRNLWPGSKPDFSSPIIQKWILLLVSSCPDIHKQDLGHLLEGVTRAAPKTLGLVLFRFLTNLRVTVSSGWTFSDDVNPESFSTRSVAEFNLTLVGESFQLEQTWENVFKPLIPELGRDYLRILHDRLQEIYGIFRTTEKADERYDPWCGRGDIRERDAYREHRNASLVVDCLLDVVEEMSEQQAGLPVGLIEDWLAADCPTLVRVGLVSLLLSKNHTSQQKVKLLSEMEMVYPAVYGAEHETYAVLVQCYPDLNPELRAALWQRIDEGPKYPAKDGFEAGEWAKRRQYKIDNLTAWLAVRNKDCPIASAALKRLKTRAPEFREDEAVDRAMRTGGVIDMAQSPKSAADLLSQKIDSQIEFLLTYQGEPHPSGVTRIGLVAAVGEACAQNHQWAITLFEELAKRQNWTSDLWEGAFWRLRLNALPAEKLTWLLEIFDKHFANSPNLQGLTFFLFNGVEFTDQKAPPQETLQALIRVSVHIWNQIKKSEPAKTAEFEKTEWTNHAINHPGGRIAEFWIKCWSFIRPKSPETSNVWPDWLKSPLEDMAEGKSYAAQLGRAILGNQMPFVHAVDPAWARTRLFPKFKFAEAGEEAFLLWEPHLKYGQLSRDLIIEMMPLYRQAFARFQNVGNDLAIGLYRHVAVIIYSHLVDVNQDGWLKEFLLSLTDEQRTSWANQMEFVLRNFPNERKQIIWDKWMKDYWQGRLLGKPCHLAGNEAGEMLEWALATEPAFSSAVDFVVQGPPVKNRIGTVLFHLERATLIQTQPQAVLKLFKWLLTNCQEDWPPSDDMRKVIMALPKKKSFVPDLVLICEQLARLGYTKAIELKAEIRSLFIED